MKTFLDRDLIIIDIESNGLYGQPFCVGAVRMDLGGRVLDRFIGRCPLDEVEDDYVLKNVVPAIRDIERTHEIIEDLEAAFIDWYAEAINPDREVRTIVDCGFPVDCKFLHELGKRRDDHGDLWRLLAPYPLYDLASVLAGLGVDPLVSREEFAAPLVGVARGRPHDPCWDAEISGLCVVRAMRPVLEMAKK